jgi:group I intron endonuclease
MLITVYLVFCSPNGKVYIGMTCKPVAERWKEHLWAAKRGENMLLLRAIRKYGADAFYTEPLCTADDREQAGAAEKFYISYFQSTGRKFGYNVSKGGDGIVVPERTPEWCQRISEARKGHGRTPGFRHTEDSRQRIGQNHNPASNAPRGVKTKLKHSQSTRNWWVTASPEAKENRLRGLANRA